MLLAKWPLAAGAAVKNDGNLGKSLQNRVSIALSICTVYAGRLVANPMLEVYFKIAVARLESRRKLRYYFKYSQRYW